MLQVHTTSGNNAISSSVQNMLNQEKKLSLSSQNIANSANENYQRVDSKSYININGFSNNITYIVSDERYDKLLTTKISEESTFAIQNRFAKKIDVLLGNPTSINNEPYIDLNLRNLNSVVNTFFNAIQQLSIFPSDINAKKMTINTANDFAELVQYTSNNLYSIALEIEDEISNTTLSTNKTLLALDNINKKITASYTNDIQIANLIGNQNTLLRELSEFIEIDYQRNQDNRVIIDIADGRGPLLNDFVNQIYYQEKTLAQLENGDTEKTFFLDTYNKEYNSYVNRKEAKQIYNVLSIDGDDIPNGYIRGLIDIQNTALDFIAIIDDFCFNFGKEFNQIYSQGINFPGTTQVSSQSTISNNSKIALNQPVEIILLDKYNGNPALHEDGTEIKPMSLELNGKTMQDMITEINNYYNPTISRVQLGEKIRDVQLISKDYSNNHIEMEIFFDELYVESIKTGGIHAYTKDSNGDIELDLDHIIIRDSMFSSNQDDSIFNINIARLARNTDLYISTELNLDQEIITVEFPIDIQKAKQEFTHFIASNATEPATIVQNYNTDLIRKVYAYIADENGNEISPTESGKLVIESIDNRYSVAIKDDNAKNKNKSSFLTTLNTSPFFDIPETQKNASINFQVLKTNIESSSFNTARIETKQGFSYSVGSGNNSNVIELINFRNTNINFTRSENSTFSNYLFNALEDMRETIVNIEKVYEIRENDKNFAEILASNVSGVNIDEEIAKTEIIKRLYQASSRMIETYNEVFDALLKII